MLNEMQMRDFQASHVFAVRTRRGAQLFSCGRTRSSDCHSGVSTSVCSTSKPSKALCQCACLNVCRSQGFEQRREEMRHKLHQAMGDLPAESPTAIWCVTMPALTLTCMLCSRRTISAKSGCWRSSQIVLNCVCNCAAANAFFCPRACSSLDL